jgi:hypothetical protein
VDTHVQKTQGSNAERAEGGLNPEASFTELDETTAARMTSPGGGDVASDVKRQMKQAPGGQGDVAGRSDQGGA